MAAAIQLGIVLFLISLALVFGTMAERRHFRSLSDRESTFEDFLITQVKHFPNATLSVVPAPQIFVAETVIATDYLKSFLGHLRGIFGGEMRSYGTLLERARRETVLRIVEQARAQNYNAICNLRLETADVGGNTGSIKKKGAIMVAILGSATAYQCIKPSQQMLIDE